jgi:hypothetical protein
MRKKTKQKRRRTSSPRPEQPTILPTSYTTSWDLTSPTSGGLLLTSITGFDGARVSPRPRVGRADAM